MDDHDWLAERFEENRPYLRAAAYRMLGSLAEADDAVQEAWLRLTRSGGSGIENLGGWLTTVVGRVCLDMLRSRQSRREEPLGVYVPDSVEGDEAEVDPEHDVLLADSIGLALLVVLETLAPAERIAFVLHDMFDVPFDEIAPVVGRSPAAARQLASRARRRVKGGTTLPDADLARQRAVVEAFLAATRAGDFEALLVVLDPDVVLRTDVGAALSRAPREVRGAHAVARGAVAGSLDARSARLALALVNGSVGVVVARPWRVVTFEFRRERIAAIDVLFDPDRLRRLDVTVLPDGPADVAHRAT